MSKLIPIAVFGALVYLFLYRRKRRYVVARDFPDAENWSEAYPSRGNPPMEFREVRIGEQFTIDNKDRRLIFERISLTNDHQNARSDIGDTFVFDTDIVTLVSTPLWNHD